MSMTKGATGDLRAKYLTKWAGTTRFMLGDEASALGAIYAGCSFFGGYPITPASEVAEVISQALPQVDGYYIQMEDEIASISAVIGAVWAGAKAMTATSGPGFSLMQESIGYACMTETPCVIINVQRSGPSTGQATKPAQGDVMQARWGTHGDHEMIALAPSTVQECLELTVECFNLAERYRNPVILLMDGEIGHLRERIVMPDPEDVHVEERRHGKPGDMVFGGEPVPPMIEFGRDQFIHVTGSTHKPDGMRDVSAQDVHEQLVTRLVSKIENDRDKLERVEEKLTEDADVAVISFGAAARPSLGAVLKAREMGLKVGFMRLIGIWPFPRRAVRDLGKKVDRIYVPEMSLGQVNREVERFVECPVIPVPKIGGVPHTVSDILTAIEGGDGP
jgi:2-oxoglutarate ferredoxin oxidoreductase subunit alpha